MTPKKAGTAKTNGGPLGFEATLWSAADKLRNNLDAAEHRDELREDWQRARAGQPPMPIAPLE